MDNCAVTEKLARGFVNNVWPRIPSHTRQRSVAEEFDPLTGRMLGNFPQAYSHVGLINCALNLCRQRGPVEERAESAEVADPLVTGLPMRSRAARARA